MKQKRSGMIAGWVSRLYRNCNLIARRWTSLRIFRNDFWNPDGAGVARQNSRLAKNESISLSGKREQSLSVANLHRGNCAGSNFPPVWLWTQKLIHALAAKICEKYFLHFKTHSLSLDAKRAIGVPARTDTSASSFRTRANNELGRDLLQRRSLGTWLPVFFKCCCRWFQLERSVEKSFSIMW